MEMKRKSDTISVDAFGFSENRSAFLFCSLNMIGALGFYLEITKQKKNDGGVDVCLVGWLGHIACWSGETIDQCTCNYSNEPYLYDNNMQEILSKWMHIARLLSGPGFFFFSRVFCIWNQCGTNRRVFNNVKENRQKGPTLRPGLLGKKKIIWKFLLSFWNNYYMCKCVCVYSKRECRENVPNS